MASEDYCILTRRNFREGHFPTNAFKDQLATSTLLSRAMYLVVSEIYSLNIMLVRLGQNFNGNLSNFSREHIKVDSWRMLLEPFIYEIKLLIVLSMILSHSLLMNLLLKISINSYIFSYAIKCIYTITREN